MSLQSQPRLSYDLHEEMLSTLAQEFSPFRVADEFVAALQRSGSGDPQQAASQVFGDFGRRWMKRSLELGEQFTDATYEALKRVIDKTGAMRFPLVPQRFVEIAYLGVLSLPAIKVVQNNGERLVYRLPQCDIYQALTEKAGDAARPLPCQHACLSALETLFAQLDIPVEIEMEARLPQEGYCQFAATRV
jgi:hypothetical protein